MSLTLGILELGPRVTLTVAGRDGALTDPIAIMRKAKRRFAYQGADHITLIPRRDGEGWAVKPQERKKEEV